MADGLLDRLWKWGKGAPVPPASAAELTPYAVMFAMPGSFNYAGNVRVSAHKGLLFAEALGASGGGDGRFLTVWRDRPAYEAARASFLDRTGLPPQVLWEGFHLAVCRPGKPWRLTWAGAWAAVATLALVLTNLQTIWGGYGWLVGPPAVEPTVTTDGPHDDMNPLVGDPFRFEVSVRNTRSVGDCSVEFKGLSADPPDGLAFDPIHGRLHPDVKPDGTAVLVASGKGLVEGKYQVLIQGRATAGIIPSKLDFTTPPVLVRVWGEAPRCVSGPNKKLLAGGEACEAEFELDAGSPHADGLGVETLVQGFADVHFLAVHFQGAIQVETGTVPGSPGKEVAYLDWNTPPLVRTHTTPFTLILESTAEKGRTAEEWDAVVRATRFQFSDIPQPKPKDLHGR